MAKINTTFVLVPGAWHQASCLNPIGSHLELAGYQVRSVDHVTVGAVCLPNSFTADVERVHGIIAEEVDKGRDVVLFMHSYGGMVGSEACRGVAKTKRQGPAGGVLGLIYCCAFMVHEGRFVLRSRVTGGDSRIKSLSTGVSLMDAIGGKSPPWFTYDPKDSNKITVEDKMAVEVFYNDLASEHATEVARTLKHHSLATFESKLTYAAWNHIPATYILCTKDNAIPIAGQEAMVEGARISGAQVETVRLKASHSPFYSVPEDVAAACLHVVENSERVL